MRHAIQEEFEDTKGAIRIRISKKNSQHNDQKKKYKRTNNDLQNITRKLLTLVINPVAGHFRRKGLDYDNNREINRDNLSQRYSEMVANLKLSK
jgi:hypothetical protein